VINPLAIPNKTMSSLEIAELTGKRHDHVMTDISKMLNELNLNAPDFSGTQKYGNNNTREIFNLDEELSLTLVSGYNVKMRNAIIKRWHELEVNEKPLSLEEMTLRVIEGQQNKILQLENKIEADKPLTAFGKAVSQSVGTCLVGDWIKAIDDSGDIKIGRNKAFRWLREQKYLLKDNMPRQKYIDSGLFEVKESLVITGTRTFPTFTTLLTGKGQMVLAEKLKATMGFA